ncbi:MAG: cold shock domain-containing protein [bacterium]|nr:cold shock domain-containing protein [bacterium]
MSKGKVKYFNDLKGWGFIHNEKDSEDVYVHYTDIRMNGFKTLKEGQNVIFEVVDTGKGFKAQNVNLAE